MHNVKGNLTAPMNFPRQRRQRSRGQVDPLVSGFFSFSCIFKTTNEI
jgi:hypothetical protein